MSTSTDSSRRITSRPFLPNLDPVLLDKEALARLTDDEMRELVATKVADVTHSYVGLEALGRTVTVAQDLVPRAQPLPRVVRGQLVQPGGEPAERIVVEPALPQGRVLGKGVVAGAEGVFALPIPTLTQDDEKAIRAKGLGLRVRGGAGTRGPRRAAPGRRRAGARRRHAARRAPVLSAAGWYSPAPVVPPASLSSPGSLVRLTNVTALVAGETTTPRPRAARSTIASAALACTATVRRRPWVADAARARTAGAAGRRGGRDRRHRGRPVHRPGAHDHRPGQDAHRPAGRRAAPGAHRRPRPAESKVGTA